MSSVRATFNATSAGGQMSNLRTNFNATSAGSLVGSLRATFIAIWATDIPDSPFQCPKY